MLASPLCSFVGRDKHQQDDDLVGLVDTFEGRKEIRMTVTGMAAAAALIVEAVWRCT